MLAADGPKHPRHSVELGVKLADSSPSELLPLPGACGNNDSTLCFSNCWQILVATGFCILNLISKVPTTASLPPVTTLSSLISLPSMPLGENFVVLTIVVTTY